jgi:hypothetical protein
MHVWLSRLQSGNIAASTRPKKVGVLDMAKKLEGFAQRLRELRQQENLSQTGLG